MKEIIYTENSEFIDFFVELGYEVKPLSAMKSYTYQDDLDSLGMSELSGRERDFLERTLEGTDFLDFDFKVPIQFEVNGTNEVRNVSRQRHIKPEGDCFQLLDLTDSCTDNTVIGRIHTREHSKAITALRLTEDAIRTNRGFRQVCIGSLIYTASFIDCFLYKAGLRIIGDTGRRHTILNDTLRMKVVHKMLCEVFRFKYDAVLPLSAKQLKFQLDNDLKRDEWNRTGFRKEISLSPLARDIGKSWEVDVERMNKYKEQIWTPNYRNHLEERIHLSSTSQ